MNADSSVNLFKRHKKIFIIFVVLVIVIISVLVIWTKTGSAKETESKSDYQTIRLSKMDLSTSVSVTGTIASKDSRSISASVKDIKVEAVNAAVGDYVNEGDVIITLDSSDIQEELDSVNDSLELETEKTNKNVSDAASSISDAQEAYQTGVTDQESMVADAKTQYDKAVASEAEKKTAYESAQSVTQKAKSAYESLNDKKSSLKKSFEKAEKAYKDAKEALNTAQTAYDTAQATAKDENGNVDPNIYQAFTEAQTIAQQTEDQYDKAKKIMKK